MTTPNEELRARHVKVLGDFASAYDASSENGQALRAAIAALAPAQEPAGGGEVDWMRSQLKALAKQASDDDMREKLHGLAAAITNPSRPYLATPTPQAGGATTCGCGRPGEYETDGGLACNKYFRCKSPATPTPQSGEGDALKVLGHTAKPGGPEKLHPGEFERRFSKQPAPASPQGVSDAMVAGLTSKQAWWAGARAGLGLPADTPRADVAAALAAALATAGQQAAGVSDAVVERAKRASDRLKEWRKSMPAVWYGNAALDEAAKVLDEVTAAGAAPEGYYLASFKHRRDGVVTWWGPNDKGYTPDLATAGIYRDPIPGYHDSEDTVPVPAALIDRLRVRRVIDPGDSLNGAFNSRKALREWIAATPNPGAQHEEECQHADTRTGYDSVTCTNCGAFKTDSQWGIARNRWFRSRADAEFYRQNGRLPEAQHGQEVMRDDAAFHGRIGRLSFTPAGEGGERG